MFQTQEMYDYAKVFIAYNQNIQACGFFGCPLELAIKNDNLLTVKLLVENGTDVQSPFLINSLINSLINKHL